MKLTMIFLTVVFLNVSAKGLSQNVSFSGKEVPLKTVLSSVEAQTGFLFLYSSNLLQASKPVSVSLENVPLKQFLSEIFKSQPLKYSIRGKNILISEKSSSPARSPRSEFDVESPPVLKCKVTDSTGIPLARVSVVNKTSGKSGVTNAEGILSLLVSADDVIQLSYIGMESQTIRITKSILNNPILPVVLRPSAQELKDVEVTVSTGYQTLPKERVTGSFTSPDMKTFESRVAPSITNRLIGLVSGLRHNSEDNLSIRGQSTIHANDQPLIVVDNFPFTGQLSDLNVNDVESISVLKDAAAASIWGARAGNGVIVITTRKGRRGDPLKVQFRHQLTIGDKPDLSYAPNYMSASDYIDAEQLLFNSGKYLNYFTDNQNYPIISPVIRLFNEGAATNQELDKYRQSDVRSAILKEFYQPLLLQQHFLQISGSHKLGTFYISGGYDHERSNLKENSNGKYTLNMSTSLNWSNRFELIAGLNFTSLQRKTDGTLNDFISSSGIFPYTQFYDEQNQQIPQYLYYDQRLVESVAPAAGFLDWSYYPLKELGLTRNETKGNNIRIFVNGRYKIMKGFHAELAGQVQQGRQTNSLLQPRESFSVRNLINQYSKLTNGRVSDYPIPLGGIYSHTGNEAVSRNLRAQLSYQQQYAQWEVSGILGAEINEDINTSNYFRLYGYNEKVLTYQPVDYKGSYLLSPYQNYGTIPYYDGQSKHSSRIISVFSNATVGFKEKYYISGSARMDGSNYFGVNTNQKLVPLWSAGVKWRLHKEAFFDLPFLSAFDLRATYGYSGNLATQITGVNTLKYRSNASFTGLPYTVIANIGNPDLRWEKIGQLNIGMDIKLHQLPLSASIEYYYKNGKDLIGDKPFAPSSGILEMRGNYSNLRANGIDVMFRKLPGSSAFTWSSDLQWSYTNDHVTVYKVEAVRAVNYTTSDSYPMEGYPVHSLYSFRWGGLNPQTGDPQGYDADGNVSSDYNKLMSSLKKEDLVFNGNKRARFFGAFNNRFNYKKLEAGIQIVYKIGYQFRLPSLSYSQLNGGMRIVGHPEFAQRWQKPGDELYTNVPSFVYPALSDRDNLYQYSTVTVASGSHIRLQDIYFSYQLQTAGKKANCRLFINAENLGIIWKANKNGYDPDYVPSNNAAFTTYPAPFRLTIGLSIYL